MSQSFGPPGSQARPSATPAGMPGAVGPALTGTASAARALIPGDRRRFDNRRVRAALLDTLLVAVIPVGLLMTGSILTEGAWLVFNAFALIYYFLSEVTTGQTVGKRRYGLRVVADDGRAATAGQVSARTVLRLIDNSIVGILVLVLSGGRRKRLGDMLGNTVVVDALPDPGRPARSPLTVLYPIGWVGAAVAVFIAIGHHGDVYLAAVEDVCEQREQVVRQLPEPMPLEAAIAIARTELQAIQEIEPPPERRLLHTELVLAQMAWLQTTETAHRYLRGHPEGAAHQRSFLQQVSTMVDERYTELGLSACVTPRVHVV